MAQISLSVAIPTYRRERVLVETIDMVAALSPAEILVIDQSEWHDPETRRALEERSGSGIVRWIQVARPSIPHAMNVALKEASASVVLFLDDDVRPDPALLTAHSEAHRGRDDRLVAGRVIQPWDRGGPASIQRGTARREPSASTSFMGGNFSLRREVAIGIGGFDENFVRVAYHFEEEFAQRWLTGGHEIFFVPAACLHHLKVGGGGTRTYGDHLTTAHPSHSVGAYYCFLRTWSGTASLRKFLSRPFRAVATRHHLRRPWFVLPTLIAEFGGMAWAIWLAAKGPQYLKAADEPSNG